VSGCAVEVKDLTVRFGNHVALEKISLCVPAGARLAIVGPNGAGKSTLLRAILGLVPAREGTVEVGGEPPARIAPDWVAYVPQVKTLNRSFPAISLELVISGLRRRWPGRISREDRARAEGALALVGGERLAGRPIRRLSGGELQRVYLARTLVSEPRLILLDEPLTGVDAVGEADFYHILEEYQERTGVTLFIVTHDWDVATYHSTHVLLIDRKLITFGPPKEALTEECLRKAYGHLGHSHEMLRARLWRND